MYILFASRLPTSLQPTSQAATSSQIHYEKLATYARKYLNLLKKCFKSLPNTVDKYSKIGSEIEDIGVRGCPKEATRTRLPYFERPWRKYGSRYGGQNRPRIDKKVVRNLSIFCLSFEDHVGAILERKWC